HRPADEEVREHDERPRAYFPVSSVPGSAWDRTVFAAPPRFGRRQAEPARPCGPRQSLGPRRERSYFPANLPDSTGTSGGWSLAATGTPGRTRSRPFTTTRSVGDSPDSTICNLTPLTSRTGPSATGRNWATSSPPSPLATT